MQSVKSNCFLALVVSVFALASATAFAGDMPMVSDAWVRSAPASTKAHAGYLTLHNHTGTEVSIVGAASPQYMQVDIHHSRIVDGVATMTRQDQITLAPGGMLKMAPGGFHLMLLHPTVALQTGDAVNIDLKMANGETLSFTATVKKSGGMPEHGHSSHKMN